MEFVEMEEGRVNEREQKANFSNDGEEQKEQIQDDDREMSEEEIAQSEESFEYTDASPPFYQQNLSRAWTFFRSITWQLEFKDKKLNEQYHLFKVASTSPILAAAIALVISLCFIAYWTLVLVTDITVYAIILTVVSFIFAVLLFWCLVHLRFTIPLAGQQTKYFCLFKALETFVTLGVILTLGFTFLMRSVRPCTSLAYSHIWACTPTSKCRGLPGDMAFVLLFLPFTFSAVFPFVSVKAQFLSLSIGVIFLIAVTINNNSIFAISWVVACILVSFSVLLFYHLQHMELFLYTTRFYEIRRQQAIIQRRLATKLKDEMRHLVSSVSHDLKSPLSAFIHGFEGLKESLAECTERVTNPNDTDFGKGKRRLSSSILFMTNTINSLVGTYQILLMTINRLTDYTRLSHGIGLTPTFETVHLADTLNAPISCVKDLQGRIDVELELVDKNLSEFIVTDRQWLQDNVLCLVSNAVKFSMEGKATVRAFLTSFPSPDALNKASENGQRLDFIRSYSNSISNGSLQDLMVRIEVEDSGVGLHTDDPEDTGAIFQEPDFTRKREMGGAGLGLHCLAKRVEALQGEYGACNRKDDKQGSLFWFTIPFKPIHGLPFRSSFNSSSRASPHSHKIFEEISDRWLENEVNDANDPNVTRFRRHSVSSILSVDKSDISLSRSSSGDKDKKGESEKKLVRKKTSFSLPKEPLPSSAPLMQSIKERAEEKLCFISPAESHSSLNIEAALSPLKRLRVLVVDDSMPIVKMLKIMLERNGYEVTTAGNGFEAVELYRKTAIESSIGSNCAFDGILMDLQMPVMDGIEAIKKIRQLEKPSRREQFSSQNRSHEPHQLIVAMSAASDENTVQEAYEAGGDEFLSKPFNLLSFQKIMQENRFQREPIISCKNILKNCNERGEALKNA